MRATTRYEVQRRLAGRTLRELTEELGLPAGDRAALSDIANGKDGKVSNAKEDSIRQALGLPSLYRKRYRVEVGEPGHAILMEYDTPQEREDFLVWAASVRDRGDW